jgi:HEAT repeat protein
MRAALVRAGFDNGAASAALIEGQLTSTEPRARVLALRAAAQRQLLDEAAWRRAICDESAEVRRDALTLYAYDGPEDDALRTAVIGALEDPDALVVDAAAFALGEHLAVDALDALVRVAGQHSDARCREAAIAALGSLGDDRGRAAIIAALDDKAPVRRRAVVALANFEGPGVEAALARAREDRDWQVRASADQLGDDEL